MAELINGALSKTLGKVTAYEKTHKIEQLVLFIVIVPHGQGVSIKKIFDSYDTSACFFISGEGTASSEKIEMMGLPSNKKQIIMAITREDKSQVIKEKLQNRFNVSRASAGIALTTKLTSIAGVSLYKFLSNTRKV